MRGSTRSSGRSPRRATSRLILIAAVLLSLVIAGCGGASQRPRAKFASTYPAAVLTQLAMNCRQAHDSAATCHCALAGIEQALAYPALQRAVPAIESGGGGAWFDKLQVRCAAPAGHVPRYFAPKALAFIFRPIAARHIAACGQALQAEIAQSYATGQSSAPAVCSGVVHGAYLGIRP